MCRTENVCVIVFTSKCLQVSICIYMFQFFPEIIVSHSHFRCALKEQFIPNMKRRKGFWQEIKTFQRGDLLHVIVTSRETAFFLYRNKKVHEWHCWVPISSQTFLQGFASKKLFVFGCGRAFHGHGTHLLTSDPMHEVSDVHAGFMKRRKRSTDGSRLFRK